MKTYADLVKEAKAAIREITPEDVVAWRKSNEDFVLLDVRESEEFEQGRIPGAVNLPRGLLELEVGGFAADPGKPVVCCCGGGGRSALAAKTLQDMGYTQVTSLAGGFKAWASRGLPVQK